MGHQPEPAARQKTVCRVLIADDEHLVATGLAETVRALGHDVVAIVSNGEDAVAEAERCGPDLIAMLDIRMPKLNGIDAAKSLYERWGIPSLIVSAFSDEQHLEHIRSQGDQCGVYGYLLKPVGQDELRVSITVLQQRIGTDVQSRARITQLERNLVNRRIVEQAKWKMVKQLGIEEPEAHERLQREARNRRCPLVDVAKAVLESDELLS